MKETIRINISKRNRDFVLDKLASLIDGSGISLSYSLEEGYLDFSYDANELTATRTRNAGCKPKPLTEHYTYGNILQLLETRTKASLIRELGVHERSFYRRLDRLKRENASRLTPF